MPDWIPAFAGMTWVKNPLLTTLHRAKYNKEPQEVQMVFRPGEDWVVPLWSVVAVSGKARG